VCLATRRPTSAGACGFLQLPQPTHHAPPPPLKLTQNDTEAPRIRFRSALNLDAYHVRSSKYTSLYRATESKYHLGLQTLGSRLLLPGFKDTLTVRIIGIPGADRRPHTASFGVACSHSARPLVDTLAQYQVTATSNARIASSIKNAALSRL
jgi:hypothetical protein